MSHIEVEDPDDAKSTAHTSTLESPTKKPLRRPSVPASIAASIPHLSYLNEAARDSVRERWNGEALEIEESSATRKKEFTDYPEGGFGWVIVASKCGAEVSAMRNYIDDILSLSSGTFMLCFLYLGIFYAWGVVQDALYKQGLAKSMTLSVIGGITAFWIGPGCLLVSHRDSANSFAKTH
jgi:hypothetical protein